MNQYELQEIWKKKLCEFNDVMRLDSIIIRAMQEAIKQAESKQYNIADVNYQRELLKAFLDWQQNKYPMPYDTDIEEQINAFEAFNCA